MYKKIIIILNLFLLFNLFWFSILIHELGHCFFVVLFNGKIISIRISLISGNMFWKGKMTTNQSFLIHIGGIIFAFIYSIILLVLSFIFKKIDKTFKISGLIIIWCNLITTDFISLVDLNIFYYVFISIVTFVNIFIIFNLILLKNKRD